MASTATPKKTPKSKAEKKKATADEEFEEWKRAKQLLKPPDQVELCDAELKEMIPRVLQAIDPQKPDSLVVYDFQLGEFVPVPSPGKCVTVFSHRGTYLHIDGEEARKQLIAQGVDPGELGFALESQTQMVEEHREGESLEGEREDEEEKGEDEQEEEGGEGGEGEDGEQEGEAKETEADEEARPKAGKKLVNQFNFCERAALTYNNPRRAQGTQTIPPALNTFSAQVLQWTIYDDYAADFAEQEIEKERERERREQGMMPTTKHKPPPKKKTGKTQLSEAVQARLYDCWKILERILNLNTFNYIAQDYRYWDDPADEFRENEGTLLPLWKFVYDKTKRHSVTDMCWNPLYYDLFVASFGFLDFTQPTPNGAVCFFTIKNPSFPDYIIMTDSAAMCIDIHKDYPYMLVVGLYDGNALVYNIERSCKQPAYASLGYQKHNSLIWEVKWVADMPDGELNFYSVSSDGTVKNWILMQNKFAVTTIINLHLETESARGPDGTFVKKIAAATCLTFHPTNQLIYYVGIDSGLILKCSTLYCGHYLFTYKAHYSGVYRIDFNKFNENIFVSCSADWRVKVWEDGRLEPLYVFDLGAIVGDVRWAPYSSTVFGAISTKGKAYIFDINTSQHKAVCVQGIVPRKKFKATRLTFNYALPIIICGDDKGCITTLKLSPNLRIKCKAPKKQQWLDQTTLQKMKLASLLSTKLEPLTLSIPRDPLAA